MNSHKITLLKSFFFLWILFFGSAARPVLGQTSVPQPLLTIGHQIEKELKAGETHRFTLDLSAGEFVHLVAEQKAMDVVVTVIDPAGNQVVKVNYFDRMYGPEPVFWIANQAGLYEIRITPFQPSPTTGKYSLELRTRRLATDQDRECIRGLDLIKQAEELLLLEKRESHLEAINRYQAAADLFHSLGYIWMEATSLYPMATTYSLLGNRNRGIELFKATRERYQTAGDDEEVALMNWLIGSNYADIRMYSEGITYLKQVVEYGQKTNQVLWEAYAQYSLGSLYEDSGDSEKSFECFNRALFLGRLGKDQNIEAGALARVSRHYQTFGDYQKAMVYAQQSYDLFQAIGNPEGANVAVMAMALMQKTNGNPEAALETYKKLTNLSTVNPTELSSRFSFLGQCSLDMKKYDQALDYFTKSLEEIRKTKTPALIAIGLGNIAAAYSHLKNYEKSLDYYLQALELTKELKEPGYNVLIYIAQVYHSMGNLSKAREYYQFAIENRRTLNQTFGLYDCYNRFAKFEYQVGNLSEAKKLLESAIEAVEQVRSGRVNAP